MVSSREERAKKILLPYQREWIRDPARFKIWLKARQIGASFATALEAVLDCIGRLGATWVVLSNKLQTAREFARHARLHCRAIGATVQAFEEFMEGTSFAQERIQFPNEARIILLAANPDTARGYAGNVVLDEFAHHEAAKDVYAAVFPIATRGHRLIVISTPWGESGPFYELWSKKNDFSKHSTDIYQAIGDGLEVNLEELRNNFPYDELWQSQFECKFISDASSWIPFEQIVACESVDATIEPPAEWFPVGGVYMGGDIGRRRDLTVFWLFEKVGDVLWTRAVTRLRGASFAQQKQTARELMDRWNVRRFCQDASGLGMQLAEELQQEYGYRVEPITFNLEVKEDLAVRAKRIFEEKLVRIPEERELRASIHAVRRITTIAGNFRFDAERTEQGHADEFWALALGALAAEGAPAAVLESIEPEAGWYGGTRLSLLRPPAAAPAREEDEEGTPVGMVRDPFDKLRVALRNSKGERRSILEIR